MWKPELAILVLVACIGSIVMEMFPSLVQPVLIALNGGM